MSRKLQLGIPCVLTTLAAVLAASPTYALIAPRESRIGQVTLYMREKTLRDRLGPPDRIKQVRFDVRRYVYRDKKLSVDISRKTVYGIQTRSHRQKTRTGVGVGSTLKALRRAEASRLTCEVDHGDGACWIYVRRDDPRALTEFVITAKRVTLVRVAPGGAPA